MSMTSVSWSWGIRCARSGGNGSAAAVGGAVACWRGGVHSTFGAGAVPATPRTPGVPHPASRPTLTATSVSRRNARDRGPSRGTSGWLVGIRAGIRLWAKGSRRDRGSRSIRTTGRARGARRRSRSGVRSDEGTARSLAVGGALLQDAGARRAGGRRRQGRAERGAGEAGQAGRRGRPPADPAGPVRVPGGGAGRRGAPRPARRRRRLVPRGRRGEAASGAPGRAAAGGAVAALRRKGPADQEGSARDRAAARRLGPIEDDDFLPDLAGQPRGQRLHVVHRVEDDRVLEILDVQGGHLARERQQLGAII